MDNTCVRFSELATDAPFDDNHIIMTSENSGYVKSVLLYNRLDGNLQRYSNSVLTQLGHLSYNAES